jgi:hypothetical protein
MRPPVNYGEFAKVLVQRYENPILLMGMIENFIVSRILRPITGPNRIVTRGLKRVSDAAGNAGIDE